MATQQFIAEQEAKICDFISVVDDTIKALDHEIYFGSTGLPYPENHDHWGTLAMNAHVLSMKLEELNQQILIPTNKV